MLKKLNKHLNNERFCHIVFFIFMLTMIANIVVNFMEMYFDRKDHKEIKEELSIINGRFDEPIIWTEE